jgi:hypothetical protein
METIQEIAGILRSTDKMAAGFVERVRDMVGSQVSDKTVLQAMKKLNPRALDINKVATAVKVEVGRQQRRAARSGAATVAKQGHQERVRSAPPPVERRRVAAAARATRAKTMMDQLGEVLDANWMRAEREGFEPQRMSAPAFIDAVHRHSDPRDATRKRILQACKAAESRDLLITPTLVADMIREQT